MARYYSTRTDVERILGEPVMDENVYDSPDGRAIITYSHAQQCEDGVPGIGNIPRDKVIEIYLSLATPTKISDVLVPEKQYIQIRAVHTPTTYYEDDTEGIRYSVNDGVVNSIDYFASSETRKKFTCAEYKYAAPVPANLDAVRIEQYPFDRYGKILFEDAKARLDNFMIQLFESK